MIKIEKIIPGGQALGQMEDGKKILFWNALPGENVIEYNITKQKSHYCEAIATSVINQSDKRITPKDDCFLSTSPWQIIDWDYENDLKTDLIVEIFREHGIIIDKPNNFSDNQEYFYRNKMEYALYWDQQTSKIQLAFRHRGSHKKLPIFKSSIERPEIFAAAQNIIDELNQKHEEARKYQTLLLRSNQKGEVSGGLYENHQPHPKFKNLSDEILGYHYSYSPNGFFQINLPVYELALKEIKKIIKTDEVLDLYAGVGTIGLSVARDRKLTLVEVDKFAFEELNKNVINIIHAENIERVSSWHEQKAPPVKTGGRLGSRSELINTVLSRSEEALDYIKQNQTVILDPPRSGCDDKLIEKLNTIKPTTIIYLSCNPSTQARDVKKLLDNYKIKDIKTFNFFPRTPHIENLVILNKSC